MQILILSRWGVSAFRLLLLRPFDDMGVSAHEQASGYNYFLC